MMKIAVVIPAAGGSTRFGDRDKLAENLGGRPLLLRTVEFFTKRDEVDEIIVAAPSKSFDEFKEKFGPSLAFHGVNIIQGSDQSRCETVALAIQHVSDDIDLIAVHDAARPALRNDLFDRLIIASNHFDAVIPALHLTSTVKKVTDMQQIIGDEDEIADSILGEASQMKVTLFQIDSTQDRTPLWSAQTPQMFKTSLLRRGYEQNDLTGCTDDAQVIEKLGEPVHLIEGDSRNIKVTTYNDYKLVKAILGIRDSNRSASNQRF